MTFKQAFRFVIFYALLSVLQPSVIAQQALNLDFETKSIEGVDRPWGWGIDDGSYTQIVMDSAIVYKGNFSLKMWSLEAGSIDDEQAIGFSIEPYAFLNDTIEIVGRVKTDKLNGEAYFKLGYKLSNEIGAQTTGEIKSETLNGSSDWKEVSLKVYVPEKVESIEVSLHHEGVGSAWFDHFTLLDNGVVLEKVDVAESFTEQNIEWLNKASHTLDKVTATKLGSKESPHFSDLQPFGKMVKEARVIALGEATHGTSEFFSLKHRVLEYAVHKLGVRVFALEDNQLIVERANRYVHGGEGTARQSMNGLFSVWQNREVHTMIQWVRQWNDEHPGDKVSFVGFDIQNLNLPMDSLYAYVGRKSQSLQSKVHSRLSNLKENMSSTFAASKEQKREWYEKADEVLQIMKEESTEWLKNAETATDSMNIYWGVQYANLVKQHAENLHKGHISLYRDVAMAENVEWILNVYKPGEKIVLWAHDYHVSLGEHPDAKQNIYNGISMGAHLRKKLGHEYMAFGLSTYDGFYWAQLGYSNFTLASCPLYPAPMGSLDEALHQIALKRDVLGLILDLRNGREEPWLTRSLPTRFANHVNIEYGYWSDYSVPYQFDGIFFIDVTNSANSYARN